MKTLGKFVMLLAILAICMPVQAEILIYNKTIKASFAVDDPNEIGTETTRGFLVLEVTRAGGRITSVDDAVQINYRKEGSSYWSEWEYHTFDIKRVDDGNKVQYTLAEVDKVATSDLMYMLSGSTSDTNIGLADPNEVPKKLNGIFMQHDTIVADSEITTLTLKLNTKLTIPANQGTMDLEGAYDLVRLWLISKGYTDLPVDLP